METIQKLLQVISTSGDGLSTAVALYDVYKENDKEWSIKALQYALLQANLILESAQAIRQVIEEELRARHEG